MKALIADDDPIGRRLLETFLAQWDYEVVVARDGMEAWNILQHNDAPKLAILDWIMPGMDGIQICRELRRRHGGSYIYSLLLTAKFQKTDIIAGLNAGADDYLTKPFDASELKARLRAGRRILELEEHLRSAYDKLQFQATHDPLTGVLSRAAILGTMQTELTRAQRQGTTIGILLADLDHFKRVNDTYGHLAGDAVLREVAQRMRSSVRPYDMVGRYGGEEFLVVLPGCSVEQAMSRAEELRLSVGRRPIETSEGIIPMTLSLGVTVGGGLQSGDLEWLLRAADVALYQAKNGGRNQVEVSWKDLEGLAASPQKIRNPRNPEPALGKPNQLLVPPAAIG